MLCPWHAFLSITLGERSLNHKLNLIFDRLIQAVLRYMWRIRAIRSKVAFDTSRLEIDDPNAKRLELFIC